MRRLILFSLVALLGCQQTAGDSTAKPAAVPREELPAPVSVAKVESKDLHISIPLTGVLKARVEVDISSKGVGRLGAVKVDVGDMVKENQLLASLEARDVALSIKQAEAQLASAKANKSQADIDAQRIGKLSAEGVSTETELTGVQTKQTLASSTLDSAEASLSLARESLRNSAIKSPVDGVVVRRNAEIGQTVSPGLTLFTIHDTQTMTLEAGLAERDLGRIHLGQQVEMTVEAYPGVTFTGKVKVVGRALDAQTRKVPMKIEFDNADGRLLSQMYARARLQLETHTGALVVPSGSLLDIKETASAPASAPAGEPRDVFIVKGEKAERRRVTVGAIVNGEAEILSGLAPGDTVVLSGQSLIKESGKVRVAQ
jgi:RND family efflux transporter MFP subunit